jgi:hypothetical protein
MTDIDELASVRHGRKEKTWRVRASTSSDPSLRYWIVSAMLSGVSIFSGCDKGGHHDHEKTRRESDSISS